MNNVCFILLVALIGATFAEDFRIPERDLVPKGLKRASVHNRLAPEDALARDPKKTGEWTKCSNPRRHLYDVTDVTLHPAQPKPGDTARVRVAGTLKEPVDDGTFELSVAWGSIELFNTVTPLCDELRNNNTPCPVSPGPFTYEKTFDVPKEMPGGEFVISFDAVRKDHRRVTCIEMDLVI